MRKWYEEKAPHQDIVLSSRIRLARNICDFPFQPKMTEEQRKHLTELVSEALKEYRHNDAPLQMIDMTQRNEMQRYAMVESHSVSREFVKQPKGRMLGLSENESVSIMINEEDHLRIQVLENGLNLTFAYQTANAIDDVLDQHLDYAFDEKWGYLTTCPTNLGTGLRASVMLHLPALEKSGMINQLTGTINKLGLTIRGTYGEGSKVLGSIYQISNQITLGITEQDAIQNLESIVLQVVESEKQAREQLLNNRYQLEDAVFRSYGVLQNARMISSREFFEEISNVRFGLSLGIITDIDYATLNWLMTVTGTAAVCSKASKELPAQERDYQRAQMIRECFASTTAQS